MKAKKFQFLKKCRQYILYSDREPEIQILNRLFSICIAEPFPLQITLIAIFAGVILVLLVTILVILFRRRICCYDQDGDKVSGTSTDSSALANNVILKVRSMKCILY